MLSAIQFCVASAPTCDFEQLIAPGKRIKSGYVFRDGNLIIRFFQSSKSDSHVCTRKEQIRSSLKTDSSDSTWNQFHLEVIKFIGFEH